MKKQIRIDKNLKYLLAINEISGSELARKLGISQASISRIISINRIPKIKGIVESLSLYFKVDEKWITDGHIIQHKCNFELNVENTVCPKCKKKLSDFIKPLIRLNKSKVGISLFSKLTTINQWIKIIRKIDIAIENADSTIFKNEVNSENKSLSVLSNLLNLEKTMLLKERSITKLDELKANFEKECNSNLRLEDYLDEENWDEDNDTYGDEGSLRENYNNNQSINPI